MCGDSSSANPQREGEGGAIPGIRHDEPAHHAMRVSSDLQLILMIHSFKFFKFRFVFS